MTSQRTLRSSFTVATILLVLGTGALAAQLAQPANKPLEERRVFVWRTETDDTIDLAAIRGRGGFLGVGLLDLTPELRHHFGVPQDRGVMISKIVDDSPAARADLRPADIVTAVDGDAMASSMQLSMRVATAAEGTVLSLERWRAGRRQTLTVPLELRVRSQLDISPLIVRRGELSPGREMARDEAQGDEVDVDHRWVERVVETVGDQFAEGPLAAQMEALRQERNVLLEALSRMEARLGALEGELRLLHEERPD